MTLEAHHAGYLKDRGVSDPAVIEARGYRTITSSDELLQLGYSQRAARSVPGLLLPIYNTAGELSGSEYRPDEPYVNGDGKPVKFVKPIGQINELNVHPLAAARIRRGSPFTPVLLAEGVTRGDALLERGVDAATITGIWSWKADTGAGSATLSALHDIPLKGRHVWVAPDGDCLTNPGVNAGTRALSEALLRKGAAAVSIIVIPGGKGLDDLLAEGFEVERLQDLLVPSESLPKLSRPRKTAGDLAARDDTLPLLDDGSLAEAWLRDEGLAARYLLQRDVWAAYHDGRWIDDPRGALTAGKVHDFLTGVARRYIEAATDADSIKVAKQTYTDLRRNSTRNNVRAVASGMSPAHALDEDFDAHPHLLNVANGTLDLVKGELRDFDARDLLRGKSPTTFDPAARAPRWERFVQEVLPDAGVRTYLQRLLGVALLGETREHLLPVLVGKGRNGKSVLLQTLAHVLGTDYAGPIDRKLLIDTKYEQHAANLMALKGKRIVFAAETEAGERFAAAQVKALTGGDMITARGMRENWGTFRATHSMILVTNSLPDVDGADDALWARLRLIHFTQSFVGREERGLEQTLAAEASGILNWLLDGLQQYLRDGLGVEPDGVTQATRDWRQGGDSFQGFAAEMLVQDTDARLPRGDLMAAYTQWCRDQGADALSAAKVTAAMRALEGVGEKVVKGSRQWSGVRLRDEAAPSAPQKDGSAPQSAPSVFAGQSTFSGSRVQKVQQIQGIDARGNTNPTTPHSATATNTPKPVHLLHPAPSAPPLSSDDTGCSNVHPAAFQGAPRFSRTSRPLKRDELVVPYLD